MYTLLCKIKRIKCLQFIEKIKGNIYLQTLNLINGELAALSG